MHARCRTGSRLILGKLRGSHFDVSSLDDIETREDTSSSNTSEDVSTSTLHQRHEAFVSDDLHAAVEGGLVVDASSGGHHHSTSDGIDGVGSEARDDGDGPSEEEGDDEGGIRAEEERLDGIVKTEVKTSVDEDTDAGDGETSVETADAVGGEGLLVDIDETVVLSLAVLALGVVGESGSGVVEGVDDGKGHGTSETTGSDVGGELDGVAGVLAHGEESLDLALEGEVQSLGGEVSEDVGKVSSPEGSTPSEAMVRLVQSTMPVYRLSRTPCLIISSWFWTRSLTRSIGAAAVLETPAATPESMNSSKKLSFLDMA